MSDKKPVIVYGASGYTGRLICEYLRELNVPFTAVGRNEKLVKDVMDKLPGTETARFDVTTVKHDKASLVKLFKGASVVCNTVGPFISYGGDVVEACLEAGCHYLDTTGEQDWVLECKEKWGADFARKGLLLSPGVAHMYTTGEIAAQIALETPGLDTLDILTLWGGFPTTASTQTIFTILKAKWYYLEQNEYKEWPTSTKFDVVVPGQHEMGLALPWGGTSHPIWFKDDPRVANVKVAAGVFARPVMEGVIATVKMYEDNIKPLPMDKQIEELQKIASSIQSNMPPRENPRVNRSIDSVHASGPLTRVHVVIHGNSNYKQTGLLQAYAAYSLIQQPPKRAGFASAGQAFGHRELLGVLQSFGFVGEPIVTVNR